MMDGRPGLAQTRMRVYLSRLAYGHIKGFRKGTYSIRDVPFVFLLNICFPNSDSCLMFST